MYTIKLPWHAFNVALEKVKDKYLADYPRLSTAATQEERDAEDMADSNLIFFGIDTPNLPGTQDGLFLIFNHMPVGWNHYDDDGVVIAPDAASEAEAIYDYWNDMTAASQEALDYRSRDDLAAAMERAKQDIVSKDISTTAITAEQRKILMSMPLTYDDCLQIDADFPAS